MKHNFITQLKKDFDAWGLTPLEKASLKKTLFERIGASSSTPTPSPYHRIMIFSMRASVFGLMMMLGAGGGLTYASQNTLPGDRLYGFKVHVVEEIKEHVQPSPEARARIAIERATERLDEAHALLLKEELTPEHIEKIHELITENIATTRTVLARHDITRTEKALDIYMRIETRLRPRHEALRHAQASLDFGTEIALLDDVAQHLDYVIAMQQDLIEIVPVRIADASIVQNKVSTIKENLARIESLIPTSTEGGEQETPALAMMSTVFSSESTTQDTRDTIQSLITSAEEKIANAEFDAALKLLREAEKQSEVTITRASMQEQTIRARELRKISSAVLATPSATIHPERPEPIVFSISHNGERARTYELIDVRAGGISSDINEDTFSRIREQLTHYQYISIPAQTTFEGTLTLTPFENMSSGATDIIYIVWQEFASDGSFIGEVILPITLEAHN
ncbi:MAG: DUF5667 domain-containing protein [Candidatus Pacebacteria bacterium]|nr:DUF5667 domain-containing protein [Candidatus Paceibacterota bacterium]MCD8507896.1 DUF5667 domain-containing protein [Candidatus Paceibacterota bacterium]MCD8527806.1 DUF5667 domain-containing protein [Candidatus Paceibacterota bacterium]MCD8563633.1 DUF5667 domain-containing protein [Candidatus Paceibacterota bacterium]